MKNLFTIIFCLFISSADLLNAQTSPLDPVCTFNYQAVIRDVNDQVIPNRAMSIQLTVLDGPGGNELYIEEHSATTTSLGLVNLEVGGGLRVGGSLVWAAIPWAIRKHFLKVEVDPDGGTNYTVLGESPILAVPIAIQAKVAAFTTETVKILDTLKVKIICVDSVKGKKIKVDKIMVDKLMAKDVCTDEIKMVVDGEKHIFAGPDPLFGGILVNFDRMEGCVEADTIKLGKIKAQDVCAVDIAMVNTATGDEYNVLEVDNLTETVIGHIDELKGCVKIDEVKTTKLSLIDPVLGNEIGAFGPHPSGNGSLVRTDYFEAAMATIDQIKTNDICLTGNLDIKNQAGESVFSVNPNLPTPLVRTSARVEGDQFVTNDGRTDIEGGKISLRNMEGADGIEMGIEDGMPFITFIGPEGDILAEIRMGPDGFCLYKN